MVFVGSKEVAMTVSDHPPPTAYLLEAMLQSSPGAAAYLDRGFRIVYVNRAFVELCQRAPEDLVGHDLFVLYPDAEREAIFQQCCNSGNVGTFHEKPFIFSDQPARDVFYLNWTLTPIKDDGGEVTGLVVWLSEVTHERATSQRTALIAAAIDASEEVVFLWSLGGTISAWWKGARMLYGFTEHEALGANPHTLLRSETSEPWPVIEAHVRAHGHWEGEIWHTAKSGRRICVLGHLALLHPDSNSALVVETNRDITVRLQAEEELRASERRFVLFMNNSPAIAWAKDADGRHVYLNRTYERQLGVRLEDWRGKTDFQLWPPEVAQVFRDNDLAVLRHKREVEVIEETRGPDGRVREWLSCKFPFMDASGAWFVGGVGIDLTDRLRAERELRRSDERKSEFLAMLSHELRNPLAPIASSIFVLEHSESGGEHVRRAQAIIKRQVEHITRLVDDLLNATRIARGKIELECEHLDLVDLVQRTVADHHDIFEKNGIALDLSVPRHPIWLRGDATRLAQILSNLLGNALKFTERGGRVSVDLSEGDGITVLQVRDDGIGIAPDARALIFEPFGQATQGLDRRRGGLGLGLAVAKGLVELHHGSIEAASEGLGRGARFTIRLPTTAGPAVGVAPVAVAAPVRHRVLVIEDNADSAEALQALLELCGHEVRVASNGPDGIRIAHDVRPQVVLCDIGLPGMDGYAIANAFRTDSELRSTFLIALTGYARQEDVARATAAGFNRHLAKPVSPERLMELISYV
jgi:PAS domain S-box-containing protein